MHEGWTSHHPVETCPYRIFRVRFRVYLADGGVCHIQRAVKIKFKIQHKTFNHTFAILPSLDTPIILGTDFLSKTKSSISYSEDPTPKSQPIRAVKSITIPPFSEMAITGQVTCFNSVSKVNGVTDNLERSNRQSQYLVQRSIVTPNDKDRHPLILMNIMSRICRIRKGEIVGLFTKTEINNDTQIINTRYEEPDPTDRSDSNTGSDSDTESIDSDHTFYVPTPDYSTCSDSDSDDHTSDGGEIMNSINTEVPITTTPKPHEWKKPESLSQDQFENFKNLLDEFEDIFVGNDDKLGRTHLYTHKIQLKPDAKQLQFYPFRMAPHKAELLERECEKLVKQDILEETNTGPWSSRSFLVEKKRRTRV